MISIGSILLSGQETLLQDRFHVRLPGKEHRCTETSGNSRLRLTAKLSPQPSPGLVPRMRGEGGTEALPAINRDVPHIAPSNSYNHRY